MRLSRLVSAALALALGAYVVGCGGGHHGGGSPQTNTPTSLTASLVSGGNQVVAAGTPFPAPVVVAMTDQNGAPAPGVVVTVEDAPPPLGTPHIFLTATTDAAGHASFTIASSAVGTYYLFANASNAVLTTPASNTVNITETAN